MSALFTGCARGNDADEQAGQDLRLEARGLGAAAGELLKADPYPKLTVELVAVEGQEPEPSTLTFLADFLAERLNKPGGIRIIKGPVIPSVGVDGLNEADLVRIESQHRTAFAKDDTATIFILFLDNHHMKDTISSHVLGLAYQSTSIAVFKSSLRSEIVSQRVSLVEKTVLAHELGHLFGLVNLGTSMNGHDHYDTENNRGHCNESNCLMNYSVSSGGASSISNVVPSFDEHCLNDLRAAGGR